ncbi:YbaK/EbsC family protein, partial [Bacillus pumilus]
VLFKADDAYVLILTRGDHEVNDVKVKNLVGAQLVELATREEVLEVIGTEPGFVGPVKLEAEVDIYADLAVKGMTNAVAGANEADYHYVNVNAARDVSVKGFTDLRVIQEGDVSPDGEGTIQFAKGIEVEQCFKLGTRYSESMEAMYLDENVREQQIIRGCYGIAIYRTRSAIVE